VVYLHTITINYLWFSYWEVVFDSRFGPSISNNLPLNILHYWSSRTLCLDWISVLYFCFLQVGFGIDRQVDFGWTSFKTFLKICGWTFIKNASWVLWLGFCQEIWLNLLKTFFKTSIKSSAALVGLPQRVFQDLQESGLFGCLDIHILVQVSSSPLSIKFTSTLRLTIKLTCKTPLNPNLIP